MQIRTSARPRRGSVSCRVLLGGIAALVVPLTSAPAATLTFDADTFTPGAQDGSGIWNTTLPSFWDGSANVVWPDTGNDLVLFGGGTAGTAGDVQLGFRVYANGLTFNNAFSGTYALRGGSLTLMGASPAITTNADASIRSVITGSTLDKNGAGILTLYGSNTYSGQTSINAGTLRIVNVLAWNTSYVAAPVAVVNSGATLDLSVVAATPTILGVTLTLNGLGAGAGGALVVNNSATWTGPLIFATATSLSVGPGVTFTSSTATETLAASVTKNGAGTWALTSAITGTGGLIVNAGTVTGNASVTWQGSSIINGGSLQITGAGTNAIADSQSITVNAGGVLDWQQTGAETFSLLTLNGSGLNRTGALVNSAATAGGVLTLPNGLALASDSTLGAVAGGSLNLGASVISGSARNLTIAGAGAVTSAGANTFSGTTTVTGGTLLVNGVAGTLASSSGIIINGGKLALDNVSGVGNRIGDNVNVTLSRGGELNLSFNAATDTTEAIGNLGLDAGASAVSIVSGPARVITLAATSFSRASGATALIRGTSLDQSATTNVSRVTFASTAGLDLIGTNTLTGGGPGDATAALKVVPYLFGDATPAGAGSSFLTYDTTLGLRALVAAEQTILAPGATTAPSPVNAIGFNGTLAAGSLVVNSLLLSTASAMLDGTSTALTINSGALAATAPGQVIGSGFASVTLGNGAWNEGIVTVTAAGTLILNSTLAVSGSGGLTKSGAGTLTLAGLANSYSGPTTLNQGILNFAALGSLGTGVNLNLSGGTLQWAPGNVADISTRVVTINGPATLDVGANDVTLANGIGNGGGGSLTKTGAGALTLGGSAGYTGGTVVAAGTLRISDSSQLGTGALTLGGGTLQSTGSADLSGLLTNVTFASSLDTPTAGATTTLGNVIGPGDFTKTGPGTLTLGGVSSTFSGNKTFNAGTTNLSGTITSSGASVVSVGNAGSANAILRVVPGATVVQDTLAIGNAAGAGGAVFQSGGTLTLTHPPSNTNFFNVGYTGFAVGNAGAAYGYYQLGGGSLTTNEVDVASTATAASVPAGATAGVMDINGGTLIVSGFLAIGRNVAGTAGTAGVVNVNGGTVNLLGSAGFNQGIFLSPNASGSSVLTLNGGSVIGPSLDTFNLNFNTSVAGSIGMVNLNGGSLQIYGLYSASGNPGAALLNFNGGALRFAGEATFTSQNSNFLYSTIVTTIYARGAIIDDDGGTITIYSPLLAAAGSGLASIAPGSAGAGYVAPPVVRISGGGGVGASAVAVVDTNPASPTYGQITGYQITNPGTGYTSLPTITLTGGGGSSAAPGPALLAPNASTGGLTKTGDGTLILAGVNTYTGPTIISAGALNLDNAATQTLSGNFSGPGQLIHSGLLTVLSGTNTNTGPTTISGGILQFAREVSLYNNNHASWNPANILVSPGGTLGLNVGGPGEFSAADVSTLYTNLSAASGGLAGSYYGSAGLGFDTTNAPGGNLTLNNDFTDTNSGANSFSLTKLGSNALTLSGHSTYTGNTTVRGGTLNLTGTLTAGNLLTSGMEGVFAYGSFAGPTVVNVSNNLTVNSTSGAYVAGAVAVFNQTAGTVNATNSSVNGSDFVAYAGYGYMNLTGGSYHPGVLDFSVATGTATGVLYVGGAGVLNQAGGGAFTVANYRALSSLTIGPGGSLIRDGAALPLSLNGDPQQFSSSSNSTGMLNLAGGSISSSSQPVLFGNGSASTGFVNLAGGTFSTGSGITSSSSGAGNLGYVNFAGATIRTTAAINGIIPITNASTVMTSTVFGPIDNSAVPGAPSFTGGAIFDTNGFNSTLRAGLLGAGGDGVTQANLVIPGAGNAGYIGAPLVVFGTAGLVGPTGGTPASGYALISGGNVTGIVITDPGTYAAGSTPTVTLVGGGGSIAPFTTTGLSTVNSSGGLTKTGTGVLTLGGANSLTGPLVVNGGGVSLLGSINATPLSGTAGRYLLSISSTGGVIVDSASALDAIRRSLNGSGGGAVLLTPGTAALDVNLGAGAGGANLPNVPLGAASTLTYTGTYTPGTAGVYRLGGGSGVLTFQPAITGSSSVVIGQTVVLTGANTFVGGFSLTNGTLEVSAGNTSANFGASPGGLVFASGRVQWDTGATLDISTAIFGGLTLGSGTNVFDTGPNNVVFAGSVGNFGAGALWKFGSGRITLNGAVTSSGTVSIFAGTLRIGMTSALKSSPVSVSVSNGLTFSSGLGTANIGSLAGASNISLLDAGGAAVTLATGFDNTATTYTGVLSGAGGSLSKVGSGLLSLHTAQLYTGGTSISGANDGPTGGLLLDFSTATPTSNLLAGTGPVTLAGGTLRVVGKIGATNSQSFNGTTIGVGDSYVVASQNSAVALTLALGALTRRANGGVHFYLPTATANGVTASSTLTNGLLGGWAVIDGVTPGVATDFATISGGAIAAYASYTTLASGQVGSTNGSTAGINYKVSSSAGGLTFGAAAGDVTDLYTLNYTDATNARALSPGTATSVLRFGVAGGLLVSGTKTLTIGSSANNGIVTAGGTVANASGELVLTTGGQLSATTAELAINASINNNGGGVVSVTKNGDGQLTLAGTSSTYTGGTFVNAGRLVVNASVGALGLGPVNVLPGGQVQITGGTWTNNFALSGSGTVENAAYGALRLEGATISGTVTLSADAEIGNNNVAGTVTGRISGPGALVRVNSPNGLLTISNGTNDYSGGTSINGGLLQFSSSGAAGTGNITLLGSGVLALDFTGLRTFLGARLNANATGAIALTATSAAESLDFSVSGLNQPNLTLGANVPITYAGVYTPGVPGVYRFGGGLGALTYATAIADVSATQRSSIVLAGQNGTLLLTGTNTYTGGFSISGGSYTLQPGLANQFGAPAAGIAGISATGGTIQWAAGNTVDLSAVTGLLSLAGGTTSLDTNANNVSLSTAFLPGGAGVLQKSGTGTLTLGAVAPLYGWAGGATGSAGTLRLSTATSLFPNATLSLTSSDTAIAQLGVSLVAGALTMGSTAAPATPILDLNGNVLTFGLNNASLPIVGRINSTATPAAAALVKTGSGTASYYPRAVAAYTGRTEVDGGSFSIDWSNAATLLVASAFNSSSALTLGGGGLVFLGKASTSNSQAFASTTVAPGGSSIDVSANNATSNPLSANLKALTRQAGGTLDVSNPANGTLSTTNGVTTTAPNTNFSAAGGRQTILGGWATVAGSSWAVTSNLGGSNFVSALATYHTDFQATQDVDAAVGASVPGAMSINSLRFNSAGAYTVDATGGLTVASGGLLITSNVGATNGVTFTSGTLGTGNGADLIVINNNGSSVAEAVTIGSQIVGGSGIALTKSGAGYLVLANAANNYGKTFLNSGVLQVSANGQLGSGGVTLSNNAASAETRLELTAGGVTVNGNITINSAHQTAGLASLYYNGPAGGSVTLGGAIAINQNTVGGGHFGSAQTTGGFNLTGAITAPYGVTVQFSSGTNTVSGGGTYYAVSLARDFLLLGADNGLATGAVLSVAGTFDLAGRSQTLRGLTQTTNLATITNSGSAQSVLSLSPGANETYTFGSQAAGSAIGGNIALVKTGPGTQVLAGGNSFSGGTTVAGGTLRLGSATALGGAISYMGALALTGGTLDLNGRNNIAVGALAGSGGTITDTSAGAGSTVLSTATSSSTAYAGALNDGSAKSLALMKDGSGTLTLSGASNYSGATTIFAGALRVQSATALGGTAGGTTVFSGAALEVQGTVAIGAETLTVSGTGTGAASGVLRNISGSSSLAGAITLLGASRFNSDAGTLTLSGPITGNNAALTFGGSGNLAVTGALTLGSAGSLSKDGSGTLSLQTATAYAGPTSIQAGTLALLAAGSISGNLNVTGGATFDVSALSGGFNLAAGQSLTTDGAGSATVAGSLSVTGTLAPGGSGSLGNLRVTGTLTLAGPLQARLAGSGLSDQLTTPALTLQPGATLSLALLSSYQPNGDGSLYTLISNTGAAPIGGVSAFSNTTPMTFGSTTYNVIQASDGEYFAVSYTGEGGAFSVAGGNDVVLMAVPEPGAVHHLLLGLASVAGLGRFRRRSRPTPRRWMPRSGAS